MVRLRLGLLGATAVVGLAAGGPALAQTTAAPPPEPIAIVAGGPVTIAGEFADKIVRIEVGPTGLRVGGEPGAIADLSTNVAAARDRRHAHGHRGLGLLEVVAEPRTPMRAVRALLSALARIDEAVFVAALDAATPRPADYSIVFGESLAALDPRGVGLAVSLDAAGATCSAERIEGRDWARLGACVARATARSAAPGDWILRIADDVPFADALHAIEALRVHGAGTTGPPHVRVPLGPR